MNLFEAIVERKKDVGLVDNKVVKNILTSSVENKMAIENISKRNKNLLDRKSENIYQNTSNINEVQQMVLSLAKDSFDKEIIAYKTFWGKEGEELASFLQSLNPIDNQDYQYLKEKYNGTTVGAYLSAMVYGYADNKEQNSGKIAFVQTISQMDLESFIKNVPLTPETQFKNIVTNNMKTLEGRIHSFRNEILNRKYLTKRQKEILIKFFSEKNILRYLSSNTKTKADPSLKKQMMQLMIESGLIKTRETAKKYMESLDDDLIELMNSFIQDFKEEFVNELKVVTKTPEEFVNSFLQDVAVKSGTSRSTVVEHGYIGYDKILNDTSYWRDFIIEEKENTPKNTLPSLDIQTKKITDEAMKEQLQIYFEMMRNYLQEPALSYFTQIEPTIVDLVERDFYKSAEGKEIESAINNEVNVAVERSNLMNQYSQVLVEIESIEKLLEGNSSVDRDKIKTQLEGYILKYELRGKKHSLDLENTSLEEIVPEIYSIVQGKYTGLKANLKGTVGEIFISVLFELSTDNSSIQQLGTSKNISGESAHADVALGKSFKQGGELITGIQSKVYSKDNIKLYDKTVVSFNTDKAIRYLGSSQELDAFRYFLLNEAALTSIGEFGEKVDAGFFDIKNPFLDALQKRLDYFIRYNDGLRTQNLENVRNNFYIVNMHVIPASVIFLKIYQIVSDPQENIDLLSFNKTKIQVPEDLSDYSIENLLSLLNGTKAYFNSFTLNLSEIGADVL